MTPKISFEELLVRNELDQKPVVSVEGDHLYLIEGRGEYAGGTRLETPEKIDAVRERCDDDNVNAVTTSAVTTPPSATTSAETNADAPVQKAMNKGPWSEEEEQRAVAAANECKSKYGAFRSSRSMSALETRDRFVRGLKRMGRNSKTSLSISSRLEPMRK